jgi:hypothetical protein
VSAPEVGCAWTRTVEPVLSAVSLEDVKAHARITDDASNNVLDAYIATATQEAEAYMGRGILTQTWKLVLEGFANIIPLPMAAPLQNDSGASPSTAVVVQYYDADGTLQTLATTVYDVDTVSRPGRVVLKPDQSWPSLQHSRLNGRVGIKQGIRQYVTFLDLDRDGLEARGNDAKLAAERCWSDRIWWTAPEW